MTNVSPVCSSSVCACRYQAANDPDTTRAYSQSAGLARLRAPLRDHASHRSGAPSTSAGGFSRHASEVAAAESQKSSVDPDRSQRAKK